MKKYIIFLFFYLLSSPLYAEVIISKFESEGTKLKVDKIAEGFRTPWGMAFISPKKLLVTEREGSVISLDITTGKKTLIKNSPRVFAQGQGGMLDIALSPNYPDTGWIYFTYVKAVNGKGATTLSRAKLKQDEIISWQDLLVTKSTTDTTYHFGSRITFDNTGHVYFGIGDRGERSNSQNLLNHAGTIIRLNLDGSIPSDNPFINNNKALPEIWSYGHRNPQGLSFDHKTKKLWSIEHGPRGGDEINLIEAGANYGWPVISYGKEYWGPIAVGEGTHKEGMKQPVKKYIPSIAPGSLIVYSGNAIQKWKGSLFSGSLKLTHINRIVVNEKNKAIKEERFLEGMGERIRALSQSPKGWVYFSTDNGKIFRIRAR